MDLLILIDGEFRSLIRNTIERLIGSNFKKDDDFNKEMIKKLSIRVVSSLITIQLFLLIQKYLPDMKKYVSIIMTIIFLNLLIEN
jgi:hypothetical protein|tara:strand:+ start:391 stop:645 length:255 start_codon:yes stop_codon:yes gene_type:complete